MDVHNTPQFSSFANCTWARVKSMVRPFALILCRVFSTVGEKVPWRNFPNHVIWLSNFWLFPHPASSRLDMFFRRRENVSSIPLRDDPNVHLVSVLWSFSKISIANPEFPSHFADVFDPVSWGQIIQNFSKTMKQSCQYQERQLWYAQVRLFIKCVAPVLMMVSFLLLVDFDFAFSVIFIFTFAMSAASVMYMHSLARIWTDIYDRYFDWYSVSSQALSDSLPSLQERFPGTQFTIQHFSARHSSKYDYKSRITVRVGARLSADHNTSIALQIGGESVSSVVVQSEY